ncbi:peptidylprolyl isomerase [Paenactinomyces guangxiensis]|uniref:peptidylprolyl isomerase n=2 Tax=Paenactinomyces guangxiensis TaxID=1490290 RepID=A0A7W1WTI6_9BACL|nr:peptidylprolyl isomerase [Paenactinomyces guangxiensis]MBH8592906.1 peptidylprolyl isomerase [Paenactinomyces guangxiensis]
MNIYSFLDPQFAMIVSDPSLKEKSNEMKTQLAQELAGQLYIADKLGGEEKYRKQADQTMVEIEKQLKAAPPADGGNPPKNLDEAIKGKGFTKDQLRNFFIRTSQLNSYFEQKLKDKQFDYVKVNHILVAVNEGEAQPGQPKRTDAEAKKRADEVKKKLETGGDFAKLAKEYSDDPGSKDKGGLIEGSLEEGFFVPQFTNAAKTLPLGKISDPVKTDYGYHVMKVIERKKQAIDKAPEDVKQELKNRRSTEIFEQLVKNELQFKSFLPAPKPEKK